MKSKFPYLLAALSVLPLTMQADPATPQAVPSQVQTHLRLDIKDDVKEVHFVNTNNDPYVYTKVYLLKHAEPAEILPYVINSVGGIWQPNGAYAATDLTGGRPGSGLPPGGYTGVDPTSVINNTVVDPATGIAQGQWWYYQGRRVNTSNTKVEAIKYLDGVGALIVSAEDYRFTKAGNENGMSIDEIIAALDLPNVTYSAGQRYSIYFPKYWAASDLAKAVKRVGMNGTWADPTYNTQWELQEGRDRVRVDVPLNALVFYLTSYNDQHIYDMLKLYDQPSPEVLINMEVYEYDSEVDSLVGVAFQDWKNGPGQDLFSAAARYTNGWDVATQNVNHTVNSNSSRYINFNPKFNSRYVDALSSESLAQAVTKGSVSVLGNNTGYIAATVRFPNIVDGSTLPTSGVSSVRYYKANIAASNGTSGASLYVPNAITEGGASFSGKTSAQANLWIVETAWVNSTQAPGTGSQGTITQYVYNFSIDSGYFSDASGNNLGNELTVYSASYKNSGTATQLSIYSGSTTTGGVTTPTPIVWTSGTNDPYVGQAIYKGTKRLSTVASLGTDSNPGFIAQFGDNANPVFVGGVQTTIPVSLTNTSLLGFQNDGTIRTVTSKVNTVVQVKNKGERFVIGGLEKHAVVRSVSKVPYLGDIPGLGFLTDSEHETQKTTKLAVVLDVIPVMPDTAVAANVLSQIADDQKAIGNYGVEIFDGKENDNGFDQFLLDSEKKSLDPLP